MVNWSLFSAAWSLMAIIFTILALHTITIPPERRIKIISQLCSYGKTDTASVSFPGQSYNKLLAYFINFKVNKGRHFKFFYLFALVNFSVFYFLIFTLDSRTCARFIHLLCSPQLSSTLANRDINLDGQPTVHSILLCLMLLVHVMRRFYECTFVAVANKHESRMHISHMALGYIFYANLTLLVIYSRMSDENKVSPFLLSSGSLIFVLGSWLQYSSHSILRQSRLSSRKSHSSEYSLPMGGFFTYVSCPNYLGEIFIYIGLALVSHLNVNYVSLLAFVTALHFQAASASHEWYKRQFKAYFPRKRKALIPFIF